MLTPFRLVQGILWLLKAILVCALFEKCVLPGQTLSARDRTWLVAALWISAFNYWTIRSYPFAVSFLLELFATTVWFAIVLSCREQLQNQIFRLISFCCLLESCFALPMAMIPGVIAEPFLWEGSVLLLILGMAIILLFSWISFSVFSSRFYAVSEQQLVFLAAPVCICYFFVGTSASRSPGLQSSLLVFTCSLLSLAYGLWMNEKLKRTGEFVTIHQYQTAADHLQKQKELIEQEREAYSGLRHAMKDHLLIVQSLQKQHRLEEAMDYMKHITEQVSYPVDRYYCSDAVLNSLLNIHTQQHPDLHYDIQIRPDPDLSVPRDWIEILFLLLNNSAEELERHPELTRLIAFSLTSQEGQTELKVWNASSALKDLHSEKAEESHGIGMPRVKQIASRCQATLQICQENGFEVRILFPAQKD